ncbi:hypothetical protein OG909_31770 [Streptomyces sp. NBC_01754]|uniref:hypothetical protein n=1 Tax=Streptomyces sp. NBC_01754 TaxID=2975930 RepID=UPI002DDC5530|nr:hypothetical protein [Streptomyces sp. NBC_01754]WSC96520.1 hypothetical protein OG909_31770 [Streptomyces sp. NBC_01754]
MFLYGGVGLVVALTACDDGIDGKPQAAAPVAAPAVSASPPDPDVADRAAALEAYSAMWVEQMRAYRVASAEQTDVKRYATVDALRVFERDLAELKRNRTVIRGDLGHEPEVTALDAGTRPQTVTVKDCIDLSQWRVLDTTTGWPLPLPSNEPLRYAATATVERRDGGRWMVTEYTPDGSRMC